MRDIPAHLKSDRTAAWRRLRRALSAGRDTSRTDLLIEAADAVEYGHRLRKALLAVADEAETLDRPSIAHMARTLADGGGIQ